MWGFGWYLETIAGFERARRLTLNWELEAALQNESRFDTRMRVSRDADASFYCRFDKDGHVPWDRSVCLRKDLSRDARRRGGCGTLGGYFRGNKFRYAAERA